MDQIVPIINAATSLLWPVFAFVALFAFKPEIKQALHRLTKAELFGQSIELREELVELKASAAATQIEAEKLPEQARRLPAEGQDRTLESAITSILREAAATPKVALVNLSAELERRARQALATRGLLGGRSSVPITQALGELNQYGFPPNLSESLKRFLDVRDKIVHGVAATADDALSAIDSGITLLRALDALPNETYKVYHPGVEIFADAGCTVSIADASGVILEVTSPGGAKKRHKIFPTTRKDYEKGKQVAWEWSFKRGWDKTWYRDPDTGAIKSAWDSSAEFVGRHLDEV